MGWGQEALRHPMTQMGLGMVAVLVPAVAAQALLEGAGALVAGVASAVAGLAGYAAHVRWIERRRMDELRGPGAVGEALVGLALGAAVFALVYGSILLAGGIRFEGWNPAPDVGFALMVAILPGVIEELVLRGLVFRCLDAWLGPVWALALSAAIFGALHLANPGATLMAAVAVALEAGVMLAAAFMATRRLFLPMGLHMGWNGVQAGVFGGAVSGNAAVGLMVWTPQGPDWLSGGAFGVEASVLAVLWCGALGMAFLWMAARRGAV